MDLEEIFLKENKFVNKDGKEIKATPINLPRWIEAHKLEEITHFPNIALSRKDIKANAFLKGKSQILMDDYGDTAGSYALQLYKIK